jgi:alpha/beta superfamily hydrolase
LRAKSIHFDGPRGQRIAALLDLPEEEPRGYALFAHCFTCTKHYKVVSNVAKRLTSAGLGMFRFDFTGLGDSGGKFSETSFSTHLEDLVAAYDWMDGQLIAPSLMIGHSFGGAATLAVAGTLPGVKCVGVIAAPSDPKHVRTHFTADFDEHDTAEISIGGRPFRIGRQFVEDLETHTLLEDVAALRRPVIVFHAPDDDIVGIEHGRAIFEAAQYPKAFITLHNTDHLVSDRRKAQQLADVLLAWSGPFLE